LGGILSCVEKMYFPSTVICSDNVACSTTNFSYRYSSFEHISFSRRRKFAVKSRVVVSVVDEVLCLQCHAHHLQRFIRQHLPATAAPLPSVSVFFADRSRHISFSTSGAARSLLIFRLSVSSPANFFDEIFLVREQNINSVELVVN